MSNPTTRADCEQIIHAQYAAAAAGLYWRLKRMGIPCEVTFSNPPANRELFVRLASDEDEVWVPKEFRGFWARVE